MSKLMRIAMLGGAVILGNLIHASRNSLASEDPCGNLCEDASQCGGWCPFCFPNPVQPPGACAG